MDDFTKEEHTDDDLDSVLESIAIIGLSGRFPGAEDVESFWENIRDGNENIEFFSEEELRFAGIPDSMLEAPNYVKASAKIKNAEMFDADFFAFTPRESRLMDPQHRVFLESAWHALENAGIDTQRSAATIGIFAGTNPDSYMQARFNEREFVLAPPIEKRLSSDSSFFATRVAYKLNLKGPALTIETACSTSLVAICVACQHLMTYQCDVALAGAATVHALRKSGYMFQPHGINSPDGHCRAFDANAKGTVAGEGVATVVLKRLEDALDEGDTIHAVIKGWAVNNDGSAKVGFTAPSVDGQAEVIGMAQALAGVTADSIGYLEAHGTGTELGDPIEVAALSQAFSTTASRTKYCSLGSVKANIGHLDATAGIAGLIKAALILKNKQIPPLLHYQKQNPNINFESNPFYINTQLKDWEKQSAPRRAGVSSFGIGGTNAHVILEESPDPPAADSSRSQQLLVVSARSKMQCDLALENLANWIEKHPEQALADVAYTLQTGRREFDYCAVCVAENRVEAMTALRRSKAGRVLRGQRFTEPVDIAFMFPGQGNQYLNMGSDLSRSEPVFREIVDRCCDIIESEFGYDLRGIIYPSSRQDETAVDETIIRTEFAQPALFVIEYAMARLLMSWGIRAQAFIGHSIGEYVAATLAGVFTLDDALKLVVRRGRLMQSAPPGSMAAIPLSADQLRERLPDGLSIAVINQPGMCVISGASKSVNDFVENCEQDNLHCHPLYTSHAFHSEMMEEVLDEFSALVNTVRFAAPEIPFVSNLTGDWITERQAMDPHYWVKHARHTVLFDDGIRTLLENPSRLLIEVGPGNSLSTIARHHPERSAGQRVVTSMRHPRDRGNDLASLLEALGLTWQCGVDINWSAFYANERRRKVPLPGYPFEHKPYWIQSSASQNPKQDTEAVAQQKLADISDWFYLPSWLRQPVASNILQPGYLNADSMSQARDSSKSWLIFDDQSELSKGLVTGLKQMGDRVVTVSYGEPCELESDCTYMVSKAEQDYIWLMQELIRDSREIDGVVYLWAAENRISASERHNAAAEIESGFYVPLFLVKALNQLYEKTPQRSPLDIYFVTNCVQQVTGSEDIHPARSLILGVNKVCSQEMPHLRTRCIDLEANQENGAPAAVEQNTDYILSELSQHDPAGNSDIEIAYRGQYRWVKTIESMPIKLQPDDKSSRGISAKRLRHNGVYLITGGLGGIGRTLSEFLAESYRACLILMGRQKLPDTAGRDDWIARHGDADGVSRKINFIKSLEAKGAKVLYIACDVANVDAMETAIESAMTRFGEINGVIHAAGLPGGGLIQLKDRQSAAEVLAPKVQGALVLDALFKNQSLDFMVYCSSLAAILGGAGQVDYAAANVFLDTLAMQRQKMGLHTVSINWDAWSETGMAVETEMPADFRARVQKYLITGIRSQEGVDVFTRILSQIHPQVIVSTRAIQQRIARLGQQHQVASEDTYSEQGAASGVDEARSEGDQAESLPVNYVAPRNQIESDLCKIWQDMFGLAHIGIEDGFFELGGHSLLAVQILSRINEFAAIHISLNDFFDSGTISNLAQLIDHQNSSQVEIDHVNSTDQLVDSMSDEEVRRLLAKKVVERDTRQG